MCIEGADGKVFVVFSDPAVPLVDPVKSHLRWLVLRIFVTDHPTEYPYLMIDTDTTFNTLLHDESGRPEIVRMAVHEIGSFSVCESLQKLKIQGDITCEVIEHVSEAPRLEHLVFSGRLVDAQDKVCESLLQFRRLKALDISGVEGGKHGILQILKQRYPSLEVLTD